MKGSIRAKGKDCWQISFYTGKMVNGKRERYFETVHSHRKSDAQLVLNERLVSLEKNIALPKGRMTVEENFKQFLSGYVNINCSQRTFEDYQSIIKHHLSPALGHLKLRELQAPTIQNYYSKACETLTPLTVHKHHRILSQSLKYAVRHGLLGRNPCEDADAPSPRKKIMRSLEQVEVGILLNAARDHRFYPIIYAAVSSGLRQAELLGLRWRDLSIDNPDKPSISVNRVLYKRNGVCVYKEPKTAHSRRLVPIASKLASFLREYQAQQQAIYIINAKELSLDSLVFGNINGKPIDPGVLSHEFGKVVKRAGLENFRFHDLRHTWASLMLLRGANPKVISEALGHASVGFTLQVYSHIIKGMQSDAMKLLDEILPEGESSKINAKLTPKSNNMAGKA